MKIRAISTHCFQGGWERGAEQKPLSSPEGTTRVRMEGGGSGGGSGASSHLIWHSVEIASSHTEEGGGC